MRKTLSLAVGVTAVLVIAAIGGIWLAGTMQSSSSNSSIQSSESSGTATTSGASTTAINGFVYLVDNVTSIMYAEDPGTLHFYNGSVTFLGVTFQTICTDYYSQCPGVPPPPPGMTVTIASGAGISVNVTFADQASEDLVGGFPLVPVSFNALTSHSDPQAGILIVNTGSDAGYKVYLLVSQGPGSGSGSNNLAIAVTGLGLCSSDCIYPSPYASATVNASIPISTLSVYVNGTYDGTPVNNPTPNDSSGCAPQNSTATTTCTVTVYAHSLTNFAYLYKGSLPAGLIPAVKGDTYVFKFVATFQNGLTAIAIATTVAD
jgi:hypothetical protein